LPAAVLHDFIDEATNNPGFMFSATGKARADAICLINTSSPFQFQRIFANNSIHSSLKNAENGRKQTFYYN
jgi:hypothetical protein